MPYILVTYILKENYALLNISDFEIGLSWTMALV